MREEYNRDTNPYPSFGKKYNGEKAIISLTSWTARINTVAKTIYSLLKQCPDFHIVLVLSEEEFPKMMNELPENLKLLVDNGLIEILWVYKNYKSFKKWIFTADKYKDIPIISADDDCIYTCNYAQDLFNVWKKNENKCIVRYTHRKSYQTQGPCTLYSIHFKDLIFLIKLIKEKNKNYLLDDDYYTKKFKLLKYKLFNTGKTKFPFIFHDDFNPITKNQRECAVYKGCFLK